MRLRHVLRHLSEAVTGPWSRNSPRISDEQIPAQAHRVRLRTAAANGRGLGRRRRGALPVRPRTKPSVTSAEPPDEARATADATVDASWSPVAQGSSARTSPIVRLAGPTARRSRIIDNLSSGKRGQRRPRGQVPRARYSFRPNAANACRQRAV